MTAFIVLSLALACLLTVLVRTFRRHGPKMMIGKYLVSLRDVRTICRHQLSKVSRACAEECLSDRVLVELALKQRGLPSVASVSDGKRVNRCPTCIRLVKGLTMLLYKEVRLDEPHDESSAA